MASIFFHGWCCVVLFVFACIMIALIKDKRKRDKEDAMRIMINETMRRR